MEPKLACPFQTCTLDTCHALYIALTQRPPRFSHANDFAPTFLIYDSIEEPYSFCVNYGETCDLQNKKAVLRAAVFRALTHLFRFAKIYKTIKLFRGS